MILWLPWWAWLAIWWLVIAPAAAVGIGRVLRAREERPVLPGHVPALDVGSMSESWSDRAWTVAELREIARDLKPFPGLAPKHERKIDMGAGAGFLGPVTTAPCSAVSVPVKGDSPPPTWADQEYADLIAWWEAQQ